MRNMVISLAAAAALPPPPFPLPRQPPRSDSGHARSGGDAADGASARRDDGGSERRICVNVQRQRLAHHPPRLPDRAGVARTSGELEQRRLTRLFALAKRASGGDGRPSRPQNREGVPGGGLPQARLPARLFPARRGSGKTRQRGGMRTRRAMIVSLIAALAWLAAAPVSAQDEEQLAEEARTRSPTARQSG